MSAQSDRGRMTFREKLENFWYYHKTAVIVLAVVALAAGWLTYFTATRTRGDTFGVVVTAKGVTEEEKEAICALLGEAVGDLNGDGVCWVACQFLTLRDLGGGAIDSQAYVAFRGALSSERYEIYLLSERVTQIDGLADYFSDRLCAAEGAPGKFLALPDGVISLQSGEKLYITARGKGLSERSDEEFYENALRAAHALMQAGSTEKETL